MTQHPSLHSSEKQRQHRSVLKRFERLKYLKEKGRWEEEMSIFGLPKIKILRFKIKKEKAAVEEVATPAAAEGKEVASKEAAGVAPTKVEAAKELKREPKGGPKEEKAKKKE